MTSPELLTPAEVAALFRVDPKTVTRWAQAKKLSSIRTAGGHRRYRAREIYELLHAERTSSRHARLEALVDDYYDGDPTSVLLDMADRYGLAVTVLDRAWFTGFTQRDLTDIEWKRIAAELGTFGDALHQACADQLFNYAAAVLDTAGIPLPDTTASELPALPAPTRADPDTTTLSEAPTNTPAAPLPPPVADAPEPIRPEPVPQLPHPPRSQEEQAPSSESDRPAPSLDDVNRMVPHSARVWDYVLGGSDHYEVDRQAADTFQEVYPDLLDLMATQHDFKLRVIEYLIEQGVRQFIDIGPGLPSPRDHPRIPDSHIVAGSAAPDARVVYIDNDPLVSLRIQALLDGEPGCAVGHLHADIADLEPVLAGAARHLDLGAPVAVLLIGVMGHIDNAHTVVHRLMDGLAPSSYLALSDATTTRTALTWAYETYNATGAAPYRLRSPSRIAEFFTGLVPIQPGLVPPALWRPSRSPSRPVNTDARCAVARTR